MSSATNEGKPWADKERLRHLYVEKGLSSTEIGDRLGCGHDTILRWLRRHGIEVRSVSESRRLRATRSEPLKMHQHSRGYEYFAAVSDHERESVFVHQLVAIAEGEDPHKVFSDGDYHTHHLNGVHWDNRGDNVVLLTEAQHRLVEAAEDCTPEELEEALLIAKNSSTGAYDA